MQHHLKDKVALITGASCGIGLATARHFAEQGARVVLAARSEAELEEACQQITQSGGLAIAVPGDVRHADQTERMVAAGPAEWGRLDIVINNAGSIEPIARIADADPEAWAATVDVNLSGAFFVIHHALRLMLEQGGGSIVNISSGAANGPMEGWSHYCATKSALQMLTRCIDKEYRNSGIRSIGLSPGTVATGMQTRIRDSGINPVSQMDPSAHIPAEWAARAVAYVCSAEADDHLGQDFSIKTPEGWQRVGLPAD